MRKRFNIFFNLLLIILITSCSNNKNKSSSNALCPSEEINQLTKPQKNKYLDSISILYADGQDSSVKTDIYLEIALEYFYINEMQKSYSASKTALNSARIINDSLSMARAMFYIGDSYQYSEKDSAYYYYYQAEKIYEKNADQENVARMQYNKAYVLFYDGNYIACEVQLSKALQNLRNSQDYFLKYSCNSLLGNCLEKIGDFSEALTYHNYALDIISKLEISDKKRNSYKVSTTINISNLYDIQSQYDKSILNLQKVLSQNLKKTNPLSYARVLSNLAYSKFKNEEYKGVEPMFLESLKIADSLGNDSDLLYKYIYFGEYYISQKDSIKAIKYLQLANELSLKNSNINEVLSTNKLLAKIDTANSLKYSTEYISVSDSLNAVQQKTRDKYARIEYETTKIEDANKALSRSNIIIIIVSIALIILLLTFIIVRYIKYKNKELQFLRKQEKASEEVFNLLTEQQQKINQAKETEKSKIALELHDGVINTLYGIRLNLGFFNSKSDTVAIEKRKDYIEELKKVEGEIRTISHDLSRNTFFDNSDFNMLLEGLIKNQEGISKTRFSYLQTEDSDWADVPNLCKINLYRIIQEAILNVNKYAQAQNCIISFQRSQSIIRILIQDDGVGYDTNAKRNGIGLDNMNSRIQSLNGTIQFTSEANKGSTIEIIVDMAKAQTAYSIVKTKSIKR